MLSHLNDLLYHWRLEHLNGYQATNVALALSCILAVSLVVSLGSYRILAPLAARLAIFAGLVYCGYDFIVQAFVSTFGSSTDDLNMMLKAFFLTVVAAYLLSMAVFRAAGFYRINFRRDIEGHQMRLQLLDRSLRMMGRSAYQRTSHYKYNDLNRRLDSHANDAPHGDTLRVPDGYEPSGNVHVTRSAPMDIADASRVMREEPPANPGNMQERRDFRPDH